VFFCVLFGEVSFNLDLSEQASTHIDARSVDVDKRHCNDRQGCSQPEDGNTKSWAPNPRIHEGHYSVHNGPYKHHRHANDNHKDMVDNELDPFVCKPQAFMHRLHNLGFLMLVEACLKFKLQKNALKCKFRARVILTLRYFSGTSPGVLSSIPSPSRSIKSGSLSSSLFLPLSWLEIDPLFSASSAIAQDFSFFFLVVDWYKVVR